MEIDPPAVEPIASGQGQLLASQNANVSLFAQLHPLVIMNVSEHFTRYKAQNVQETVVIGALIGTQKGRTIEIMNSYELPFTKVNNEIIINMEYYMNKEAQFKQVFPDMDFLGWYTTGDGINEEDIKIHQQMCTINESSVLLKLNPLSHHSRLPISMYESLIDLVKGEAKMFFVEIPYTLVTEEAERVGLNHMAHLSSTQQGGEIQNSLVAEHLRCQYNAVKMLRDRVLLVLMHVKESKESGEFNQEILREASNLSSRLPALNNPKFTEEFYCQCNDVALMTYLGTVTRASNDLNQFINKFNVLYERQGMSRRIRPAYY